MWPEFKVRIMALPLSPNTAKAIEKLFPDGSKDEVVRLLTEKCADNLPNCEHEDEYDLEDLRFQVLVLSEGNIEKLREAVRIANLDWRDLSVSVGSVRKYKRKLLGDDLERNIPSDRLLYGIYLSLTIAIVTFLSSLILRMKHASNQVFTGVMLALAGICMAHFFVPLWKDLHFREHGGVTGVAAIMLLGTVMYFGLPAVIGVIVAAVLKYFI